MMALDLQLRSHNKQSRLSAWTEAEASAALRRPCNNALDMFDGVYSS